MRVSEELVREPKRVLDRLMAEGHKQEEAALETKRAAFRRSIQAASTASRSLSTKRPCSAWSSARSAERMTMPELCAHLFKDYQFGLSLIQKNTATKSFVLDRAAVDAPDKFLSELVVNSYYPAWPAKRSSGLDPPRMKRLDHRQRSSLG